MANQVLNNLFVLHSQHRYGWTCLTVCLALMLVEIIDIIVLSGLIRPAIRYGGERRLLIVGLIRGCLGVPAV